MYTAVAGMIGLFVHEGGHMLVINALGCGPSRLRIIPFLGGWHAFMDVIGRGAAGEFIPYQDESGLRAAYAAKYLETV